MKCSFAVWLLCLVGTSATTAEPKGVVSAADSALISQSANEIERRILDGKALQRDAAIDRYLQSVAERLLSDAPTNTVRVRVIREPYANAFALPNGAVFVTTELLQRLDNEAQLACVLGHEITHFTNLHAHKEWRSSQRRQNWVFGLGILLAALAGAATNNAGVAQAAGSLSQATLQLWSLASISGYSRDLEAEADEVGLRRMIAAGYDPVEAPHVFEHLKEGSDAGTSDTKPYFASHPKLDERIANYQRLLIAVSPSTSRTPLTIGADDYKAKMQPLALDQVELLVDRQMLDEAERHLVTLPQAQTARGLYLSGQIARLRPPSEDTQQRALQFYERAAALDGVPADALKQKALLHRLRKEPAAAVVAFKRYLELAPDAVDVSMVRTLVHELEVDVSTDPKPGEFP